MTTSIANLSPGLTNKVGPGIVPSKVGVWITLVSLEGGSNIVFFAIQAWIVVFRIPKKEDWRISGCGNPLSAALAFVHSRPA